MKNREVSVAKVRGQLRALTKKLDDKKLIYYNTKNNRVDKYRYEVVKLEDVRENVQELYEKIRWL